MTKENTPEGSGLRLVQTNCSDYSDPSIHDALGQVVEDLNLLQIEDGKTGRVTLILEHGTNMAELRVRLRKTGIRITGTNFSQ